MQAIRMPGFSAKELDEIDCHAMDAGVDLWRASSMQVIQRSRRF
jgi:hypothetical protein